MKYRVHIFNKSYGVQAKTAIEARHKGVLKYKKETKDPAPLAKLKRESSVYKVIREL